MEKGFEIVSTLPIWQFDVLLLVLVVVFAVVALSIRNLMGAAVVFGAYSFMMCLIWAGMGAVDVAFTEAVVGAGVSTVFVVSTLYNTGATMQRRAGGLAFTIKPLGAMMSTGRIEPSFLATSAGATYMMAAWARERVLA